MSNHKFVIHTHRTEKLHYDLRLEIGGEFYCWAFTRGISTDSATRRMGIKIENQPLDLYEYEGELTEKRYGTGDVVVWDRGIYQNIREENGDNMNIEESLDDGHIKVFLRGEKLEGGFTLLDVHYGKTKWLQVKKKDEFVDEKNDIMTRQPESVL